MKAAASTMELIWMELNHQESSGGWRKDEVGG